VPLDKELEYIQNYVELQKLRLRENVTVEFRPEGNYMDKQIAPLLLLPFVENAFKHGIDYTRDCRILILVSVIGDELLLTVENPKVARQVSEIPEGGGIGMNNIRKRLSLIYPGRHDLLVSENDDTFTVELKLHLNELPDRRR
jgi:LytS/YehU family sensor histidine kinase